MTATKRTKLDRIPNDAYYTPSFAVDLMFNEIDLEKISSSLEPCKGDGSIYDRLPGVRYYAEISENINYLSTNYSEVDLIVTNPPFGLAMEFLEKSLREARTVVYLLRLSFLASVKRSEFFSKYPLTHLFVLANRPSFREEGGTDRTEYAWFCWDRANNLCRSPGVYVLVKNNGTDNSNLENIDLFSGMKTSKDL